ncbi:MAG: hypothetical protein FWD54_00625 [Endomicrobia bacterium]|nr:hypothetical protein [Endomicrobiia bacterium]MCL2798777.1 hypothetical protein [Endomicrobiia bacterium]
MSFKFNHSFVNNFIFRAIFNFLFVFRKKHNKSINNILFIRFDNKVGDTIIDTFFIRELKKLFPKSKLTVIIHSPFDALIKDNHHIDKIIIWPYYSRYVKFIKAASDILKLRKEKYDLIIDIPWPATLKRLIYLYFIKANHVMTSNLNGFNFVDYPLNFNPAEGHISCVLAKALTNLGAKNVNTDYELFLPEDAELSVSVFFAAKHLDNGKINLLFNPEASSSLRTLKLDKIKDITEKINKLDKYNIILLQYLTDYAGIKGVCTFKSSSISEAAALIKRVDCILTVDTSIAHIADAYNKKMTVLYADDSASVESNSIFFSSKNILTKALKAKEINNISSDDIVKSITNTQV